MQSDHSGLRLDIKVVLFGLEIVRFSPFAQFDRR